jgi:hypothetical protein
MSSPHDRITRSGKTLSRRVWALLEDVEKEVGLQLTVLQGSYHSGTSASAGTHDGAGAIDVSVHGMSESTAIKVCTAFRKRFGDAWFRSPKYGWPSHLGGPHIHVIVADEPGLSSGAKNQVAAYNRGQNGLASHAHDPFPRPAQHHFEMGGSSSTHVSSGAAVKLSNLKFGARNDDVKDLQHALHITADGYYGPQTDDAVRADQRSRGWAADPKGHSYVGPRQAQALGLHVT